MKGKDEKSLSPIHFQMDSLLSGCRISRESATVAMAAALETEQTRCPIQLRRGTQILSEESERRDREIHYPRVLLQSTLSLSLFLFHRI